jgi:hypothetical protein
LPSDIFERARLAARRSQSSRRGRQRSVRCAQPEAIVTSITRVDRDGLNTPAMHKTRIGPAAATVLLALLTFAATPNGMTPLPPQYVREGTFHSPDGWFEIHVPASYEWFEMTKFDGDADPRWPSADQSVAWLSRDPKTFEDVVLMESYSPGADVIDGAYARDFEERTRKTVEPDVMSDYSSKLLTISGEQSLYYQYKLVGKNHVRPYPYRFGYVIGMEHKVMLSTSDTTAAEPKRLRQSVISLRWLKES